MTSAAWPQITWLRGSVVVSRASRALRRRCRSAGLIGRLPIECRPMKGLRSEMFSRDKRAAVGQRASASGGSSGERR
jgi:hypothetical protein